MSKEEADPPLRFQDRHKHIGNTPFLDVEYKTKDELADELAHSSHVFHPDEDLQEKFLYYRSTYTKEELEAKLKLLHREHARTYDFMNHKLHQQLKKYYLNGIIKEFQWGNPVTNHEEIQKRTKYVFSKEGVGWLLEHYHALRKHRYEKQRLSLVHPFPEERKNILTFSANSNESSSSGYRPTEGRRKQPPFRARRRPVTRK